MSADKRIISVPDTASGLVLLPRAPAVADQAGILSCSGYSHERGAARMSFL